MERNWERNRFIYYFVLFRKAGTFVLFELIGPQVMLSADIGVCYLLFDRITKRYIQEHNQVSL